MKAGHKYQQHLSHESCIITILKNMKCHRSKNTASKQLSHKSTLNYTTNLLLDICYFRLDFHGGKQSISCCCFWWWEHNSL